MDPRLILMEIALRSRAHAAELLHAHRAAMKNAEALEEVICNGNDEQVAATIAIITLTAEVPCSGN